MPTTIATLADLQQMSRNVTVGDDDIQQACLDAASDLCEQHTQVWRDTTITVTLDVLPGTGALVLRRPVKSVTSVTEDGSAVAASGWTLDADRGLLHRGGTRTPMDWTVGRQIVTVAYVAGLQTGALVPASVKQGVLELAIHLLAAYRGGSGVPRSEPLAAWRDLPNRVQMLWEPYTPVLVR